MGLVKDRVTLPTQDSRSLETIYDSAVPKTASSSSEEDFLLNSSDEIGKQVNFLIADTRIQVHETEQRETTARAGVSFEEEFEVGEIDKGDHVVKEQRKNQRVLLKSSLASRSPQPSTSKVQAMAMETTAEEDYELSPEEKVQMMIRQTEAAKVKNV